MSKGKEFPPRVWIDLRAFKSKVHSMVHALIAPDPHAEEYLSLAEHEHLVSEARREGRAEAATERVEYREALAKIAFAHMEGFEKERLARGLIEKYVKAAEGASE